MCRKYQFSVILKPLSHWAATVGDILRTAFAREFPKCFETFAGVHNALALSPYFIGLRLLATNCERHSRGHFQNVSKRSRVFSTSSHESQWFDYMSLEFAIFKMIKKFARQFVSKNSHRVVAGISNPSRILLNLVSVSQKVREMWDKFVRGWRPMKLNYDWLETKMRIWYSGRECRSTIARVSRDIRATCMRTLAIFTAIFVRYKQIRRKVPIQCDSKWKLPLIRVFYRNFLSPTSRQQSQPSEILAWVVGIRLNVAGICDFFFFFFSVKKIHTTNFLSK